MITLKRRTSSTAGRLRARPMQPIETGTPGLYSLRLEGRDGLLYVPTTYQAHQPAPLVLMLHGAGGDAKGGLSMIQEWANAFTTIVVAVSSRWQTWDMIVSRYGPDITCIDQALTQTFAHYEIDPRHIAIAGFSDGASYALSVGMTNGDLFTHILAFSPGFTASADQVGKPQCFISHGKSDTVLPIDQCSRRIVPRLQQTGYEVIYREFDGSHTVPVEIAREGMHWVTT
ncbi:phospholipase [Cyanobacteria bacterium FACHB-63]|nr:phospholipase [Cyanobacteria bacterium FACHB-63]